MSDTSSRLFIQSQVKGFTGVALDLDVESCVQLSLALHRGKQRTQAQQDAVWEWGNVLSAVSILRQKLEALKEPSGDNCPHGWADWDDCPDCRHA